MTTSTIAIPAELAAEVAEHPERFRPKPTVGQPVLVLHVGEWPDDQEDEPPYAVAGGVYPARYVQGQYGNHDDGWLSVAVNDRGLGYIISAWALIGSDKPGSLSPKPGDRLLILEGDQAGRLATVNPPPVALAGGGERLTITEEVDVERYAIIPPKVLTAYEEYQQIVGFDGLPIPEGLPAVARLLVKHVGDAAADSGRRLEDRQMFALAEEVGEYADACAGRYRFAMVEELADVLITSYVFAEVLGIDLLTEHVPPGAATADPDAMHRMATQMLGAYRRWQGMARRRGTREEVAEMLAALECSVHESAKFYGIDLTAAVRAKLEVIFTRGWREPEVGRG